MNEKVRSAARRKHVFYWQIALKLGVAESTIYRWMRTALSEERENAMLSAIEEIAKEAEDADN